MLRRACILLFTALAVAGGIAAGYAENAAKRFRVIVFPFYDQSRAAADMRISSVLSAELASRSFIEVVPPEIVRREVLEVEPLYARTERRGPERNGAEQKNAERKKAERRGVIYWKIEPKVIDEVVQRADADFAVSGDLSWFGEQWTISAFVSDVKNRTIRALTVSGSGDGGLPSGIEDAAARIAVSIRDATIVEEVEGEVRKYLGRIYSLPVVISKVETIALSYQDSLPVQAVLLDLYLQDRAAYRGKIAAAAAKITALYDPARDDDTRYLLSRGLDPFDVLAGMYEEGREWKKAINVRKKALAVFPFYAERHKKAIERDSKKIRVP